MTGAGGYRWHVSPRQRRTRLEWLQLASIYSPYAFDRVTVTEHGRPVVSLLGRCWSTYPSGPNLLTLADAAGEVLGRAGYFGLHSCRSRGLPRAGAIVSAPRYRGSTPPAGGLVVDSFAGGGGASTGIEAAGLRVDVAINHDPEALAMHAANHPGARHLTEDLFDLDPVEVCRGQPVRLLWASPDCKHFSKASGAALRDRKIRGLAWVVVRWAETVRPAVIMLENVEEFVTWGPLVGGKPDKSRAGVTFRRWIAALRTRGYAVEWRQLRACDYGAPTIRKRLFIIARCDGQPIVWPDPTHEAGGSALRAPWVSAASCIDFGLPCPSVFLSRAEGTACGVRRPLADKTMARIAAGVRRFVIDAPEPFIVGSSSGVELAPFTVPRYGERPGQDPRCRDIREPAPVVTPTATGATLVAAYLAKHWGGMTGIEADKPAPTVTAKGCQTTPIQCELQRNPGGRATQVAAFLMSYFGNGFSRPITEPAATVTTKDRLALVMVKGEPYVITDIGMRMLTPRELFRCQGFPQDYQIDIDGPNGRPMPRTVQTRLCGNSVCPDLAEALVRANVTQPHEQEIAA